MPVKLTIDKTTALQACEVFFEILQEYHDGGRGGRVHLGNVKLNLAEYTNAPEPTVEDPNEGEDGMITRRYLMQDSKVNATLKVGIAMKQTDGDTNFISPPLRSAMVIGGIAGIINTEAGGETDDMPSIASKSRELSEAQDIYRRTLAASWACDRGELPPDKLIEDIFSGGDGGKMVYPPQMRRLGLDARPPSRDESSNSSDADSTRARRGAVQTGLTPEMARLGHRRGDSADNPAASSRTSISSGVSGRGSIEQQMQHSQPTHHHHHHSHRRKGQPEYREINEFDLRDDLRSWQVHA